MPRRDWFDVVTTGNAWHGPAEFAEVRPITVGRIARLWRRLRAFLLWGRA